MAGVENDRQAVELISRALSGDLSADEREVLREYEARESRARALHEWMAAIEQAAIVGAEQDLEAPGEQLNQVSKERIKRAVREKLREREDTCEEDRTARVAEQETTYLTEPTPAREEQQTPLENRRCEGRFTLLEEIGRGGLGTVYLARDEVLGRNVALKEMNPTAAKFPHLWQRFAREAQITGHLEHPHVVPIYASGVDASTGLPFYAMRFLGKQTLADAIQEYHARRSAGIAAKMDLYRLLRAFLDVCEAIAYAHGRGVLHRDLKPENVALDRFGQVVVLDWGLAKLEAEGELHARLALSGVDPDHLLDKETLPAGYLGTPLYMAPEQAAGTLDAVDVRTDVYGLGAILYQILTGQAPNAQHVSPESSGKNIREMFEAIAKHAPPPPRSLNPHVSRDLEAICMRALSTQRATRQRTAAELAGEVEAWIAGRKERASNYESMRMAGHDLKSRLCVQMRQVAATAKFLTELPPIPELLKILPQQELSSPPTSPSATESTATSSQRSTTNKDAQEELEVWRSRLAAVMKAVLRSRPSLASLRVVVCDDQGVQDFVHVRRGVLDRTNVRCLPNSKLYRGPATDLHQAVRSQFPGEPYFTTSYSEIFGAVIECGVGFTDGESGEVSGLAIAEADLQAIASEETNRLQQVASIQLFDPQGKLIYSTSNRSSPDTQFLQEQIDEVLSELEESSEFIDPAERIYATRLPLPNQPNGITIVVSRQQR